jgi:hypothetical protein
MKPADIRRQLYEVYGEHAMSDSMVRRWVRHFDKAAIFVNTWFASQAASFYDAGIQKLLPRYDKCLNNGGNYVEKYHKVCT